MRPSGPTVSRTRLKILRFCSSYILTAWELRYLEFKNPSSSSLHVGTREFYKGMREVADEVGRPLAESPRRMEFPRRFFLETSLPRPTKGLCRKGDKEAWKLFPSQLNLVKLRLHSVPLSVVPSSTRG